jgi:hypothetical protein
MAVRTPQGLTCCVAATVDAAAAVELSINEPATNAPSTPFTPSLAISFLRHSGCDPALFAKQLVQREVSFHQFDN